MQAVYSGGNALACIRTESWSLNTWFPSNAGRYDGHVYDLQAVDAVT